MERDDEFKINVRLENIGIYASKLQGLTDRVKLLCCTGRNCFSCGYCKDSGVEFKLEGKNFKKCSIICCGFVFSYLSKEDHSSFLKLLDLELSQKK